MAIRFRTRMDELRDQNTKAEWDEAWTDIERHRWLANFERLYSVATNSRDLIKIALDATSHKGTRTVAIWVLGRVRSRSAVAALLRLLQQPDDAISFQAAGALCETSERWIVPKLVRILLDAPLWRSREGAAWILHRVRGHGAS